MHHKLKKGKGNRKTFFIDKIRNTAYLNAACVPRKIMDEDGEKLTHFSWVEFSDGKLIHVSHRWYRNNSSVAYEELLFSV